jgi:hypothetical protein
MIAGAVLAAWLADADGQKRSHAAAEALARHWIRHPLMSEVHDQLTALPANSGAAAILDIARGFMDRQDDIALMMDALVASAAADPFFNPPFHPVANDVYAGLLLLHKPELSILLGVSAVDMVAERKTETRGATSLIFNGRTTLFRYVKAGDATISFWEAPPIAGDFVASQAGKCRLIERRKIKDGEEILTDGRYQTFVIEHVTGDMVFYQATVRQDAAPLSVEYDSKTLSFIGASSTDEATSRVQMMVSMLRTMERDDAFPLIEEALASPHFYTRWHIMRELLAMDADAALPALRRMAANDPHPEVRAAAQQTLEMFFEDEPIEQGPVKCRA